MPRYPAVCWSRTLISSSAKATTKASTAVRGSRKPPGRPRRALKVPQGAWFQACLLRRSGDGFLCGVDRSRRRGGRVRDVA
ncbi:hypothetical protein AA309_14815 [Microvirga vignae]|uniref:Uncharacterized protein n=1 Tax=Microvirga vignae TaxID=1225564 RepID=A0A0H1RAN4_9HYPH|nr:hypothetical protein AA309_14815 [Microvirga vignae]